MASRTAIAVQVASPYGGGVDLSLVAGDSVNGMEFANDGKSLLVAENSGGANRDVDVPAPANNRTFNSAITNTQTVPANTTRVIGPFPPDAFNQSDGTVHVDMADATGLAFGVVRGSETPPA